MPNVCKFAQKSRPITTIYEWRALSSNNTHTIPVLPNDLYVERFQAFCHIIKMNDSNEIENVFNADFNEEVFWLVSNNWAVRPIIEIFRWGAKC